jgi:hypothetical protein
MNVTDISHLRLFNQQVVASECKSAKEVVACLGAMQSQDFPMAKWAVGVRLPGSNLKLIDSALDSGEILRTHAMRPTWHLVSSDDIYWLLELTAPQIKTSMRSRDKVLGLTEDIYSKSNALLEKALRDGKHLPREALTALFEQSGIVITENRASHLLLRAEIEGIICSGKTISKKLTYTLLPDRVPKTKLLKRDEAIVALALRYFASHGPATLQDFVWWSGLSVADSRKALDAIKANFVSETIGEVTYWCKPSISPPPFAKDGIHLLPAFDEFIISYKDRSASLPYTDHHKAVSNNGIFRPVIVQNGQVIGIWKRNLKKDKVFLETEFFTSVGKSVESQVWTTFKAYADFIMEQVEVEE